MESICFPLTIEEQIGDCRNDIITRNDYFRIVSYKIYQFTHVQNVQNQE